MKITYKIFFLLLFSLPLYSYQSIEINSSLKQKPLNLIMSDPFNDNHVNDKLQYYSEINLRYSENLFDYFKANLKLKLYNNFQTENNDQNYNIQELDLTYYNTIFSIKIGKFYHYDTYSFSNKILNFLVYQKRNFTDHLFTIDQKYESLPMLKFDFLFIQDLDIFFINCKKTEKDPQQNLFGIQATFNYFQVKSLFYINEENFYKFGLGTSILVLNNTEFYFEMKLEKERKIYSIDPSTFILYDKTWDNIIYLKDPENFQFEDYAIIKKNAISALLGFKHLYNETLTISIEYFYNHTGYDKDAWTKIIDSIYSVQHLKSIGVNIRQIHETIAPSFTEDNFSFFKKHYLFINFHKKEFLIYDLELIFSALNDFSLGIGIQLNLKYKFTDNLKGFATILKCVGGKYSELSLYPYYFYEVGVSVVF